MPTLLVGALSVAFGPPLVERMRNEVTVYTMFCTKDRVNGVCTGEEQTANPTTFKVYPEQQIVVSWVGEGPVTRMENCAVRDVSNWHCRNGHFEHTMTDGSYLSAAEEPFVGFSKLFYQGSRWRWWMTKLAEYTKAK
ncbi:hypothetical protein [Bradyrhizobium sp. USDA 4473]